MCLLEGYEDKNIKNQILKIDLSYYSGIGTAIFDPALKPVIKKEINRMKKDSVESIGRIADHAVGKRIFNHCLNFYKSKRLADLTKSESRKWRNIENISEIVSKEMPAY